MTGSSECYETYRVRSLLLTLPFFKSLGPPFFLISLLLVRYWYAMLGIENRDKTQVNFRAP
jgi:hypothetical protein